MEFTVIYKNRDAEANIRCFNNPEDVEKFAEEQAEKFELVDVYNGNDLIAFYIDGVLPWWLN